MTLYTPASVDVVINGERVTSCIEVDVLLTMKAVELRIKGAMFKENNEGQRFFEMYERVEPVDVVINSPVLTFQGDILEHHFSKVRFQQSTDTFTTWEVLIKSAEKTDDATP